MASGTPLISALLQVLLAGCSTATDTADYARAAVPLPASTPGEPPSLLSLWKFFGNRETNWGYKISPDGARVGWIGSHKSRMTVFVRTVGGRDSGILDKQSPRSVFGFDLAADRSRVLYLTDLVGDERHHSYI